MDLMGLLGAAGTKVVFKSILKALGFIGYYCTEIIITLCDSIKSSP